MTRAHTTGMQRPWLRKSMLPCRPRNNFRQEDRKHGACVHTECVLISNVFPPEGCNNFQPGRQKARRTCVHTECIFIQNVFSDRMYSLLKACRSATVGSRSLSCYRRIDLTGRKRDLLYGKRALLYGKRDLRHEAAIGVNRTH